MAPEDDALARRLDDLDRRLARLESAVLGTRPETRVSVPRPAPTPAPPPVVPPAPVRAEAPPRAVGAATAGAPPAPPVVPGAKTRAQAAGRREAPKPRDPVTLERLIGGRWFAAIGAVAITIGLALALKLAWDAGYLHLPPIGRVLAVAAFGVLLLGAGEVVLRRLGRAASAGFFGAGVGALFVAAYGAYALYELVGPVPAFALMACASGVGVLVAVRADLVSIGVLGLVGAYLAPLLAPSPDASAWALPVYLAGLTAVGVGLAWWRRRFGAVRAFAWVATVLVGTLWLGRFAEDAPWVALAFVVAAWAGFHAERALAVRPRGPEPEAATDEPAVAPVTAAEIGNLVGGLLLTAWACVSAWVLVDRVLAQPGWLVPAGFAVASMLGAVVLAGLISPLRETPRTAGERLGVTLMAQAGALLFAAVALALSGWVETLTWTAMGVAAIAAGRAVRARALDAYGLILLGFGTARAVLFELAMGMHEHGHHALGLVLTPWTALLAGTAVALVVAARLLVRGEGGWAIAARAIAALAFVLALLGLAHPEAAARSVLFAWLGVSVLWALAGRAERVLLLHRVAPVGLLAALGAWGVAELEPMWSSSHAAPGLHPGLWEAVVIAVAAGVLGRLAGWARGPRSGAMRLAPAVGGAVLLFVATTLEVARSAEILLTDESVRAGAVSLWWGVCGVGALVFGVVRKIPAARWVGLGLMLVAIGKVVIVDLAGTSPAVRVASFLGLGVLMIAVAAGYLRVAGARRRSADAGTMADQAIPSEPPPARGDE